MYFWNAYPFVRLSVALIAGILVGELFPKLWDHSYSVFICLSTALLVIQAFAKRNFHAFRYVIGFLTLVTIAYLGGFRTILAYHSHSGHHYLHLSPTYHGYAGKVVSPVTERKSYYRYDLSLINHLLLPDTAIRAEGKIHIYIRKDSLAKELQYGDEVLIYGKHYPIPAPDNPHEFDYQTYLARSNIYHHSFVSGARVFIQERDSAFRLFRWAYALRSHGEEIIDKYFHTERESGVAKALFLGVKDHLDKDTKQAYSAAGAMHVLAVSGLHVGIIYLLIQALFTPLKARGRLGNFAFIIISILLIWLYALVTGFSPSVLRAATMFSLMVIGQATSKKGNIYNTLGFTAFVLLLYDPYLIYSVGFQLSFIAVTGIVYLQPRFYRLLSIPNSILDKAWAITCVSIAAQLATFPLSAYYFHQFPTYFLVSNLLVIPGSFIMLLSGMVMLLLDGVLPEVTHLISVVLYYLMWGINEVIARINELPHSLITWIRLDRVELFMVYGLISCCLGAFHFKSFKMLHISAVLFLCLLTYGYTLHYNQAQKEELILYEVADNLAIDYIKGHDSFLYLDRVSEQNIELLSYQINPHRLASLLPPIEKNMGTLNSNGFVAKESIRAGIIGNHRIILLDSTTFHLQFHTPLDADIVIVRNESVKNLKWLQAYFQFDYLILSNENSHFYVNRMKKQADDLHIPIHALVQDGAFILNR